MTRTIACIAGVLLSGGMLPAQDSVSARGKYLVEEVAKCADCHTPKTAKGAPDRSKWLKGGTMDVKPVGTIAGWNAAAPDLTSTSPLWSRWSMEGMVKYFETGRNPMGNVSNPPMPAYRLRHDDAAAIAAYLKSLK